MICFVFIYRYSLVDHKIKHEAIKIYIAELISKIQSLIIF